MRLHSFGRNRGFARAVNEGCRLSRGEWLLLLNPDVRVPEEFLDWRHVEEMSGGGIAFGSHAATHRLLPRLSTAELGAETSGSLRTLQRQGVHWVPVFCYPNGDHSDAVVDQVKAAGFTAAVSAEPGAETWDSPDGFRLRRIGVHHDVSASPSLFTFHLWRTVCA